MARYLLAGNEEGAGPPLSGGAGVVWLPMEYPPAGGRGRSASDLPVPRMEPLAHMPGRAVDPRLSSI